MAPSSLSDLAVRFAPAVTLLLCLIANGLGSTGVVGQPVGTVSDRLKTAFTPAGSAFSIWGVIYALAVLSVGYMTIWWEHLAPRLGKATYVTLSVNFVLNGVWIFLWTGASAGPAILWTSVVFMAGILGTLLVLYRWAGAASGRPSGSWLESVSVRAFLGVYLGWITVASVANVAGASTPIDGTTPDWGLGADVWACIMLGVAMTLGVLMAALYFDAGYPAVIAWATWWVSQQQAVPGWPGTDATVTMAKVAFGVSLAAVALALVGGAHAVLLKGRTWQPAWPSLVRPAGSTFYGSVVEPIEGDASPLSPKHESRAPPTGATAGSSDWA